MPEQPTILITGATDGLGRALAVQLAREGASLILHGRSHEKLEGLAAELQTDRATHTLAVADLADLRQVRDLAEQVKRDTNRLDALVSNAGVGSGLPDSRERQTSADGYELRFAVNYLAGFLLTNELLDLIRSSAPARIVYVASTGQHPIDFDDLMIEHGYSGPRAYGQSKLAQIMSGFELAGQLDPGRVTVNSLHPSTYMPTKIVLSEIGHSVDALEEGVAATRRLAVDPELAGTTGKFFDRQQEARANPQAYDAEARGELWRRSLDLTGRLKAAPARRQGH